MRKDLARLIEGAGAGTGTCSVPITSDADLDRLPYGIDKDKRQTFLASFDAERRKLPKTCRAVAQGAGPWEVHFSHVEAGFRSGSFVAQIRSKLSAPGGTPCLGPVEVIVSASEG